jgi:hypothetical protein
VKRPPDRKRLLLSALLLVAAAAFGAATPAQHGEAAVPINLLQPGR